MVAENGNIPSDHKRKQISRSGSSDDSVDENMDWLFKRPKFGEGSITMDDYDDYIYDYADEDPKQKESSIRADEEISLQSEMIKEMVDFLERNIAFKESEIERCEQQEKDLMYSCVGEQARIATDGFIFGNYVDYLLHQFKLGEEVSHERKALEYELKRLQSFLNYHKEMEIAAFFVLILASLMKRYG